MRAVVGRDRELEKIGSFLELEDEAADVLLIEGDAGIGKTTLWRVAVDEARERGYRVLSCAGAEAEAQLSFNAVRDLLGDAFAEVADELPAPQRRALSATLLLDEDEAGPPEPDAIAVALLSALRLLAARERTIVAVDDVQWLDGASAAPLAYALRRLGPEPVAAVVSRRTEAERPDPLALDRLDGQRLDRLELRGLSLGAVSRILHQRLGTAYPRSTLRRVHEVSAGNPLFALELARALGDSARALPPGPALPLTGTLRQLVERRLAALRDDTLEVLVFAAALARPTLAVLTDAVGRAARPELAPAVDAQVVVLEGDTLQYAHPLFAAGVYALAGRSRQVEVHHRLAGVVADVEERARHLALGTEGPDAEVALAVEAGARAAFARGAPGTAAELIADALRLTPPMPRERLVERQRALADYHLLARNLAEAANVLVELVDELPPGPARADARFKLARARQNDDIGVSRALAEAALADAGGTHATAAQIECYLSNLVFAQGEADLALSHAREAVSAAEQAGNDGLHAEALTVSTWLQTLLVEEVDPGVLDKALDLDDGAIRPIYANPSLVLGVRHMYSGRLDEARAQLESVGAKALAHGDEFTRSGALIHLTELECRAGNWRAAARHVEEVAAQHQAQSGLQWARGLVAALLGRVDEAHEALELGIASAADAGSEFFRLLNVCVLGFLELSVGDHAAADGLLRPAAERLTGWCREPSVFGELPNGIEALVELGELGEAERLLAELEGRLPRLESPWARASAGRCRGMILSARGDHEGAFGAHEAALAVHERLPQPFDHARTLLALGTAQRRARQRRAARESLQVSLALFEQLGAKLWAEKARAELARIGGRARSSGELTAGERRIAELVAEGKTNKEVAAVLVIADRTVESALTQIYRKLGVRSRTELARKLAALG